MRFRTLRTVWSMMCGVACLLLIALWVRSYWWCDIVNYRPSTTTAFRLLSDEGQVSYLDDSEPLLVLGDPPPIGWSRQKRWYAGYRSEVADVPRFKKVFRGFARKGTFGNQVPDWFLLVVLAGLSAVPWLGHRLGRFSLRTLLIVTTLIALALGSVLYFSRQAPPAPRFDQGFGR
jgi:hypothetical protein